MSGTMVALPVNGDDSQWTASEKALVEAAGLVTGPPQNRRLAPRPVVEAFLLHARRTGLDPIARQIYCIERGGKWGTQVSIDGARLVAERTGQYRGQTPTQWTDDGREWVDVWLAKTPPAAARVGVFREGFAEPLFAVATFDAYNAGSPIWKKMPALMLGKCAEMLALRKAFPQDLSGLYSSEEMDQAGTPAQAAVVAPAPPVHTQQAAIVAPVASRDWAAELEQVTTLEATADLYREAEAAGELGVVVGLAGDKGDGSADTVIDLFWAKKAQLQAASEPEPMVEVPVQKSVSRKWVAEARKLTDREALRALIREAGHSGAPLHVIEEMEAIESKLPGAEVAEPVTEWPVAEVPSSPWSEEETESRAAVLDEEGDR